MPQGTMKWFDERSGEGRIEASGREYPAYRRDVEPRARSAGARVAFDVQRVGTIRTAVRVRARPGTRTAATQRRSGDLTGSARPDEKGRPPYVRGQPGAHPVARGKPAPLLGRWLAAADTGRLEDLLPLYAPHVVLHAADGDRRGRQAVRAFLVDSGLLTRGWEATLHGSGDVFRAVRARTAPDAGRVSRFRVAHGQIIEQWVDPPS